MANRLGDLRGGGGGGGLPPPGHHAVNVTGTGYPMDQGLAVAPLSGGASSAPEDTDAILNNFYKLVAEVQTNLREIQNKTQEVQVKHAEQLRSPDIEASKRVFEELQGIMDDVNAAAKITKDKLGEMSEGTQKLKKTEEDAQGNAAVIKIQQNQHAHLLRQFAQAMKDYQEVQDENKKSYEEQTARQIKIKCTNKDGTTIDDEEAMHMAREALVMGTEDQIFSQSKDTLAQIIETRNDILQIENSMRELNQLFNDLAFLVNEQGEVMDVILQNVQVSVKYVEKGNQALQDGKKHAKKGRTKMCWLIMLVFIILLFIMAPILGATV